MLRLKNDKTSIYLVLLDFIDDIRTSKYCLCRDTELSVSRVETDNGPPGIQTPYRP